MLQDEIKLVGNKSKLLINACIVMAFEVLLKHYEIDFYVEQLICNHQVAGLSPITGSIKKDKFNGLSFLLFKVYSTLLEHLFYNLCLRFRDFC
jgi:hypothetical protein